MAVIGSGVITAAVNAFISRRKTAAEAEDTAAAALLKRRQADNTAIEPWQKLTDELQDQFDRQTDRLRKYEERLKAQEDEIARLSEVTVRLRAVMEDKDRAVSENVKLRAKVTDLELKVANLTNQVSERDDLIRMLQAQVVKLTERVKDLEKKATGPIGGAQAAPAP